MTATTGVATIVQQTIDVGDQQLNVLVADTLEERSRGLSGVEELTVGIAGMLFVFESPSIRTFHMADTRFPLDVWWFDATGSLIGSTSMEPCLAEPCQAYQSPGEVGWALETPAGDFDFSVGDTLST